MTKTIMKQLTRSEAEALTETINSAAENLGELLLAAHDGKAWAALGYDSWRAYAVAEFKFSERRVYQLLNFERVKGALEDCTIVQKPIHESQVRPLAGLPPAQQREAWQDAVESAPDGKPTARAVAAAVGRIDPSRVRPISPASASSAQTEVNEAEKDSETLWLLKSYWKKATKADRTLFRVWIEENK